MRSAVFPGTRQRVHREQRLFPRFMNNGSMEFDQAVSPPDGGQFFSQLEMFSAFGSPPACTTLPSTTTPGVEAMPNLAISA